MSIAWEKMQSKPMAIYKIEGQVLLDIRGKIISLWKALKLPYNMIPIPPAIPWNQIEKHPSKTYKVKGLEVLEMRAAITTLEERQSKQRPVPIPAVPERAAQKQIPGNPPLQESHRLEKLKKLVQVSKSLKVDQVAQILGMTETELYDRIVDWATQFGFELDQEVINFGVGKKEDFIAELDREFAKWGTTLGEKV